ncbi:hypothetical protein EUY23_24890 [Salmonella enterica]|nr:hypothetical protein [Salmonella enterica]EKJ5694355.1 hypothetical protein [Salmonella enterica]
MLGQQVVQSQGHKLKRHGADSYICLCPFHEEKTPSCVITPATEGDVFRSGSGRSRSASGRGVVGPLSDTSKAAPEQTVRGTATYPGGQEENAVNNGRNKTTLRPTALTADSNRVSRNTSPEVTHG